MHPSFSGLLVTWAYLLQMTFPVCVTSPNSLTLTSSIVPFVMTPSPVYNCDCGFFLTPKISNWKVVFNSGWVTFAFLNLSPVGLMNLSYLGGLRVKFSPTNVTLFIRRFQAFYFLFPERSTWNISASDSALTFSIGTDHLPAFSLRFCLIILLRTFVFETFSLSRR